MKTTERWHSPRMDRDITLARWGHFGVPVLVLPTAGGDAEEIERHHLLDHCQDLIDAGTVKIYSCDSVAGRAMAYGEGTPAYRCWLFNRFHQCLAQEVVPAIYADCGGPQGVIVAGSSIGAFNALAAICRYPDLFTAAIAMSGSYDLEHLIGGYTDDLYFASPLHFLPTMDGPALEALRQRFIVLASGQGAWEDVDQSWKMADLLGQKGIPNRMDPWGHEWEHDWPTWWSMLPLYIRQLV